MQFDGRLQVGSPAEPLREMASMPRPRPRKSAACSEGDNMNIEQKVRELSDRQGDVTHSEVYWLFFGENKTEPNTLAIE
jgi:hypothetical protein